MSVPITASSEKACTTLAKAEHRNDKPQRKDESTPVTLRQAMDNYISARTNVLSPATIRCYNTIRDNRFQDIIDKNLKDISDWQKICNLEAKTCSTKTLKNSWFFVALVLKETTACAEDNAPAGCYRRASVSGAGSNSCIYHIPSGVRYTYTSGLGLYYNKLSYPLT